MYRSGGAGVAGYNGGHKGTKEDTHVALQNARNALQTKMTQFTDTKVSSFFLFLLFVYYLLLFIIIILFYFSLQFLMKIMF
jgi:hypothetical protein